VNDPQSTWAEISRSAGERKSREHSLVLQAMGVRHVIARDGDDQLVLVPSEAAAFARGEIERYERENRGWPPRETEEPFAVSHGVHAAIVYGGLLVLFFLCDRDRTLGYDWYAAGRANAAAIRHGEWWRVITALTLHVDALHLAGNIVFGAMLGIVLAQSIGVGLAWLGFVATGALGNAINAWIQSPQHNSIGASTAVFGILGIQVAYEWMRRRELGYKRWRRWAPLIMGLVWLGWFGTGGAGHDVTKTAAEQIRDIDVALQDTDVMAHVLGFATGALFGSALGLFTHPLRMSVRGQVGLAIAAPLVIAAAWFLALR
jgi:membrane associated rhomboid family serine protease